MHEISVLIPLYNRRQYVEDCVDGVLNQTFQDFEVIIRDDCSTDGVFEFVKNRYANEFSTGKIKIFRNKKNLGESLNIRELLCDATGKYLTILHNDDVYLPKTLERLFDTAEKYSADVVHTSNFFAVDTDGSIKNGVKLRKISRDTRNVNEVTVIHEDLNSRFIEWLDGGTFQDLQFNIFRRQFILDNKNFFFDIFSDTFLFTLIWMMTAKTFVKIPDALYIRRNSSHCQSNDNNSAVYKFETAIPLKLELFANVDKFINACDFLKNNPERQYLVKTKIFSAHENLDENASLRRGNTAYVELYGSIENTFRKIFGSNAVYLALLFHWAHLMQFNKNGLNNLLKNCLKVINQEI